MASLKVLSAPGGPGADINLTGANAIGTAVPSDPQIPANANRSCLTFMPLTGSIRWAASAATLAAGGGFPVAAGRTWEERDHKGPVFLVSAAGTVGVVGLEV